MAIQEEILHGWYYTCLYSNHGPANRSNPLVCAACIHFEIYLLVTYAKKWNAI